MKFVAIIPARFASTRFPGKPVALLAGKPIIQWVYERVARVFEHTYVATDDERIADCVKAFGGAFVMTGTHHKSGTDRCHEAYEKIGLTADVIVNVQGDEPFIATSQLETIRKCFQDTSTSIATLVKPYGDKAGWKDLQNPNTPKVVVDDNDFAMYFSRSVIPYLRGVCEDEWTGRYLFYKHIGLYAYRPEVLKKIVQLPQSTLEVAESLEQLRWLQAGMKIKVGYTDVETIGIDTPEDLGKAADFLTHTPTTL